MSMFSRVEGGQVLLTQRGVYTEAELYKRGEDLFVKLKSGFARLLTTNNTTAANVRWKEIEGVDFSTTSDGPRLTVTAPPAAQVQRRKLRAI
ncbi:hypothetical protein X766_15675 [Mesorhizobium sp. LSJC255A00]|uniref:hypothetical protein n=1 Tax=Mesorhizobium sp. LSJC255A00 TaxID=1287313 RepID=UPI0003CF278D|nr:hypothetical protein [Mesorhizobium sp. LSJC255A00]ESX17851.1 hypothetical protein X766_15675 [Mesorhizobium sp. LSJC255A00]